MRTTCAVLASVVLLVGCSIGDDDEPASTQSERTVTTQVPKKAIARSKEKGVITSSCVKYEDDYADCTFNFAGRKPIRCRHMSIGDVDEIRARLASSRHPEISIVC